MRPSPRPLTGTPARLAAQDDAQLLGPGRGLVSPYTGHHIRRYPRAPGPGTGLEHPDAGHRSGGRAGSRAKKKPWAGRTKKTTATLCSRLLTTVTTRALAATPTKYRDPRHMGVSPQLRTRRAGGIWV